MIITTDKVKKLVESYKKDMQYARGDTFDVQIYLAVNNLIDEILEEIEATFPMYEETIVGGGPFTKRLNTPSEVYIGYSEEDVKLPKMSADIKTKVRYCKGSSAGCSFIDCEVHGEKIASMRKNN